MTEGQLALFAILATTLETSGGIAGLDPCPSSCPSMPKK